MAVGVCDADGVLVMLSPAMESLLGVEYSPVPDSRWADQYCIHDEAGRALPAGADPLARALRGERVTNQVISIQRPQRPVRWGVASGIRLTDPREETLGAAVFVLDITERNVERQRLEELRDRLVETVNHEVRTPLATIVGHVEMIEDSLEGELPAWTWRSVEAISRSAHRLRHVVDHISALADRSQQGPRHQH
jgi:signal transduction histidine kinase